MGRKRNDDDTSAAAWLLIWESAVRRGNRHEEREARAALARFGVAVIVDGDSPLRRRSMAAAGAGEAADA